MQILIYEKLSLISEKRNLISKIKIKFEFRDPPYYRHVGRGGGVGYYLGVRTIFRKTVHARSFASSAGLVSLRLCKFSLHHPHKISCLVMRIRQMIIHGNLSVLKNKFSQPISKEAICKFMRIH